MACTWLAYLILALPLSSPQSADDSPSVAELTEGHYELTVTIEDTTRGRGVEGIEVRLKLRRGFFFLGRKKTDLDLRTDKTGQVTLRGLPSGDVELIMFVDPEPQKYKADLKPGPKKSIQLRADKLSMLIEWVLK